MLLANARRALCLAAFSAVLLQTPAQVIQVDLEEFRRLQGEVADLRDANIAHRKRLTELQRKVDELQSALRDANEKTTLKLGDFATREDLKKIVDRIQEVDQKRESDRKLILDEFEKLAKSLAQAPESPRNRRRDTPDEPPAQPIEGKFYPYEVRAGETLGEIREAYNSALKEKGLPGISFSDIRRANPKIDLDRIYVGQKILLPVPEKN